MQAQAYLLKEQLFTFCLPNVSTNKLIHLDHVVEETCIFPMDKRNEKDVLLATKLKEAVLEKPPSTRGVHLTFFGEGNWTVQEKVFNSILQVQGNIFRDLLILLGDQMAIKMEIVNPQVEVACSTSSETTVAVMNRSESSDQINYTSYIPKMPIRWKKYWTSSLNIKFYANISIIVCGTVVLPKTFVNELFDIEYTKQSIPKTLLEEKVETDMAIILENGIQIDCHKIFLQAQSSVFRSMMQKGKFLEGETNQVRMDDISENSVNALLAFLYYWGLEEPMKSPQVAVELLQASHKYNIATLEKAMKSVLLTKPIEWFDIPVTIKLFSFSKNVDELSELKTKSLQIFKLKDTELVNSEEFKAMFNDEANRKDALEFCSAVLLNM